MFEEALLETLAANRYIFTRSWSIALSESMSYLFTTAAFTSFKVSLHYAVVVLLVLMGNLGHAHQWKRFSEYVTDIQLTSQPKPLAKARAIALPFVYLIKQESIWWF